MLKRMRNTVMKKCLLLIGCVSLLLLTVFLSISNSVISRSNPFFSISSISAEIRSVQWRLGASSSLDPHHSNSISKKSAEERARDRAKYRSPHLSSENNTVLRDEIDLIVNAAIDAFFTESSISTDVPECKGDKKPWEVEDILCIPRPKYLEGVKSPCWLDDYLSPREKNMSKTKKSSLPLVDNKVLRCLPYFHILGCEKCGSSDLWNRLNAHPHMSNIDGTMRKEANWWAWGRYGYFSYKIRPKRTFQEYTKAFLKVATRIAYSLRKNNTGSTTFISGDGTPSDMFDFRGWPNISQNRGLESPKVITPHLMRHFYPNPKFIMIFRNPVDRLISDYFFINKTWLKKSPEDLHNKLQQTIRILAECVRHRTLRECAFDPNMYRAMPLRLHYLFYILFVPEWFKLFPRKNFLILKTEEYSKDINGTVKACMDFLDLKPLSQGEMKNISLQERFLVKPKKKGPGVLPKTRLIIEDLAKPAMRMFADLMGDERFRWDADQ